MLGSQGRAVRDDQVEVQLLGRSRFRPRRRWELGHLLEGETRRPRRVDQDQPLPAVRVVGAGRRGLVAGAVAIAEERPVELGQPPGVGAVEHDLLQGREAGLAHGWACRTWFSTAPILWSSPVITALS